MMLGPASTCRRTSSTAPGSSSDSLQRSETWQGLGGFHPGLGYLAVAHREAFVVESSLVCPERLVAEEILALTRVPGASKARFFADGRLVLLGDRGRAYFPRQGVMALARYRVPDMADTESGPEVESTVWRMLPG